MKIPVTRTEMVDMTLPHYRKSLCHMAKVYSEEKCITICFAKNDEDIKIGHAGLAFCIADSVECTAAEFEEQFNKVVEILKSKV